MSCSSNDEVEILKEGRYFFMKYKNMKEVSHGFHKKIQNSVKIALRYDHREYFK